MRRIYLILLALGLCGGGFALSGYGISEAYPLDTRDPVLHLLSPQGGDQWYLWQNWEISWEIQEANPDLSSMKLWYSLNGGSSYISLGDNIPLTPPFIWDLPEVVSHQVKVKAQVKDIFGNTTTVSSGLFSIDFEPPAAVEEIFVSVTNDNSLVLFWVPVTTTVLGNPMSPDGYIILFSHDPAAPLDDYTFLAAQKALSYTHNGVASFYDKMFYRIVAYIDYDLAMNSKLARLQENTNGDLTWGMVKAALHPETGVQP